jgi:rubrerythrin
MKDISEALSLAITLEKKGYDVYITAAERTSNKLGRETLKAIAAKEIDHINAIETFIAAGPSGSGAIAKAVSALNVKTKEEYLKSIFDKLRGQLEAGVKPDPDLEKAYEVAMGLERDSYELYRKLASGAETSEIRKFFDFLMGEENNHYEILQDTMQYLNKPADWFRQQEKWIMEG